jgi:hypothetical protein
MQTDTRKQAVKLQTGIAGFEVTVGQDGVWLHFEGDKGRKGGFNLGNYANDKGTIIGGAIGEWVNKTYANHWQTDLEKYQDCLREQGIEWIRGGDDTNIEIIVGNKVRVFNADGSDINGEDSSAPAPIENQHRLIKGYRDLSKVEIDLINEIKAKAEEVGELVKRLERLHKAEADEVRSHLENDEFSAWVDSINEARRWSAVAKTQIQQGFMALIRAVARPTTF